MKSLLPALICLLSALPLGAQDGGGFRLFPEAATEDASRVDLVYFGLLLISGAVLALLFFLLVYALFQYKKSDHGIGKILTESSWKFEASWSIIPFFIFLGLFAWGAKLYLDAYQPAPQSETIHVVGRQWMWQTYYASGRMEHNTVHLPVNQATTFVLSSEDVIHSFFVPAFRVKRDVVPGKFIQFSVTPTKVGSYRIFCAEYCGTEHSGMIGWVHVMEPEDYATWREGEISGETFAERGEAVFRQHGCSGCHDPDSAIHAPTLIGLAGRQVPLTDGGFVTADVTYLRDSILLPGKHIVAGYENLMPSYRGLISEPDLAALIAYLQSLETEDDYYE